MKVLIDTNIILDVILQRSVHLEQSKRVMQCCQSLVDGYIALHTISNMFYILHETENFSVEYCRNFFNKLLHIFDIASLNKSDVLAAVSNVEFDDIEDSMQNQAAVSAELDYIVTRNEKDFKNSTIPVVTPEDFLSLVHSGN